jgi:hypothetical protein
MTYFAQQAPPNIQTIDELRLWAEEEFRRIGQHTSDLESFWTSYTPSVSPSSGTFTSVSPSGRYKQIGKTVLLSASINFTNIGTGTGALIVSLPPIGAAKSDTVLLVSEALTAFLMGYGLVSAGGTTMLVRRYDNAPYFANGYRTLISGAYELA